MNEITTIKNTINKIDKQTEFWIIYKHFTREPNFEELSYIIPKVKIMDIKVHSSTFQSRVTLSMAVNFQNVSLIMNIGNSIRLEYSGGYFYLLPAMDKDKLIELCNDSKMLLTSREAGKAFQKYLISKKSEEEFNNFIKLLNFKQPL